MRILLTIVIALVLLLTLTSAPLAVGPEHVVARHVHCCFSDGQCLKTRRHHCDKKGGRVVDECQQCKAEWAPDKPEK